MKNQSYQQKRQIKFGLAFCLLFAASCLIVSCKKFLEIPAPVTLTVTSNIFTSNPTATAALTNIYAQMNGNLSYKASLYGGLSADEFANYSNDLNQKQIYTNSILASTNNTLQSNLWQPLYNYIYQANAIIENLQQYRGVTPAVKKQLTAEAKFVRAFHYFYLTSFFGDVPLALSTDYLVNQRLPRTPRIQVLKQIIADLKDAQGTLNDSYVDISDSLATTERVRPNKSAAAALLARAYLYLGDYDGNNIEDYLQAEAAATLVISNSLNSNVSYSLSPLAGTTSVFKSNSTETIWALQNNGPTSPNPSTLEGLNFILVKGPTNVAISQQLLNSFEANDQRKANWIGSFTSGANTWYFPYKYKDRQVTNVSEYEIMLRLGEQYLIRAEARARQNNFSGAAADLNTIRERAGLPDYPGMVDQASLLTAILHERQVELFTEWGHRWFDLDRTGNINSVMGSPGNVCQAKGGVWSSDWHVYPIPFSDLINDPNLKQNPGY